MCSTRRLTQLVLTRKHLIIITCNNNERANKNNIILHDRDVPEKTAIAYNGTELGDFSAERERTVAIVHGFQGNGSVDWMITLKDLLLEQVSCSPIRVIIKEIWHRNCYKKS